MSTSKKLALVDIDGCLTHYPATFLDWTELNHGQRWDTIEQMKARLSLEDYKKIKWEYRLSGAKASLPVRDLAVESLTAIASGGFEVKLITSRPDHPLNVKFTNEWVRKNFGPLVTDVLFEKNKYQIVVDSVNEWDLVVFIEDDSKFIDQVPSNLVGLKIIKFKNSRCEDAVPKRELSSLVNHWSEVQAALVNCGWLQRTSSREIVVDE